MAVFSALNAPLVGGISLILSIIGLFITIAGFATTIVQLRRTKSATDASANAIKNLKNRMLIFDVSVESSRVIKFLETATVHLKGKSWDAAAASLWEAQNLLGRLASDLAQPEDYKLITERNLSSFLDSIQALEVAAERSFTDFDYGKLLHSIRVQINVLEQGIARSQKDAQDA